MEDSSLLEAERIEDKRTVSNEPDTLQTQENQSNQLNKSEDESERTRRDEPDKPRESKPFDTMSELYNLLDGLIPYPETDIVESVDYTYQGSEIVKKKIHLQRTDKERCPRTMVCHDMQGGYLEDRYFWGSTSHNSYLFYNWYAIDTFIYFSHHFVTVPPYGWICAAHKHGVKILGTIITEDDTSPDTSGYQFWQRVAQSYDSLKEFADAIVTLTKRYEFDGWLLNFETSFKRSKFQSPELVEQAVDKVLYFIKYLTETLHKEVENSEVIWYDSLIKVGTLAWQNELNEKNKDFFMNCDGIYLNYQWTEDHLDRTNDLVKELRRDVRDVYVGLDIFARGTKGVGEFNCSHALDMIRQYNFSVAIFAPGWTHERFGPSLFNVVDDIFWSLLFPHLYVHVPIYEDEVFRSTFCRGAGRNYYSNGQEHLLPKRLNEGRGFYELRLQQPQLSVPVRILDLKHTTYMHLITSKSAFDMIELDDLYDEDNRDNNITTPMTRLEELYLKGWYVIEEKDGLADKSVVLRGNTFEYCDDFSYEGGGCLRLITRNNKLYHRLFLVYVTFKLHIQVSIVYAGPETGASSREPPVLILGRNSALKAIQPYDHIRVNNRWWKCVYLTNFKTVDEIGVLFQRKCECYLGEIVLDKYDQVFGNYDSEYIASLISDYHVNEPTADSPPWRQ